MNGSRNSDSDKTASEAVKRQFRGSAKVEVEESPENRILILRSLPKAHSS